MTDGAQQALRRTMEIYSKTTRFALACNQSEKIIGRSCSFAKIENLALELEKSFFQSDSLFLLKLLSLLPLSLLIFELKYFSMMLFAFHWFRLH